MPKNTRITRGDGLEFAPVFVPAPDAPIDDIIAFLRAHAARNDAIASCAAIAFDRSFRKAMRRR